MTRRELWGKIRIKLQNLFWPGTFPGQSSFICKMRHGAAERFFLQSPVRMHRETGLMTRS
ncbi:hypothetical protein C1N58_15600 [Pantoea sp. SGAir0180]|nr:hypothetical protein F7Q90_01885 [Pantoea stewartii subsp. stewartii]WRH14785.1 hypothetical protein GC087_20385 [Pantoea sp. JZ2]WRH22424.1 hypothetical protein GC090_18110 [Pantoea sp. JZ29]